MQGLSPSEEARKSENDQRARLYWRSNLRLVGICLLIWFAVSYGCGILFAEALNQYSLFGFKLGFWFAQQGSIYVFLLLIFFYAVRINALDRRFGVVEQDDESSSQQGPGH